MLSQLWSALTRAGDPSSLGPDWERPGPDAAARRNDLVVGLLLAGVTVLMVEISRSAGWLDYGPRRAVAEQLVWAGAIALPLVVRRRYPLTVLAVCSAVFLATGIRTHAVAGTFFVQICFFTSLYTAAAWGRDRRRTRAVFGVVCLVMFAWVAVLIAQGGVADALIGTERDGLLPPVTAAVIVTVVINVVYFVGAWMIGTRSWRSARQREELRLQTARLEAEQALSARRAVVADRVRIARELHDVVAHHVSLIGVQAAAARRTLEHDPDAARQALGAAEESSRRAVGEMRSLLGVLRSGDEGDDPDDARAPQPDLERLHVLVGQLRDQGLSVRLHTVGETVEVPETLALSLYRTVQEALANVLRHSTARSAQVTVRYLDGAVEVEVLDDGTPVGGTAGGGLGHQGMRERADLHGGEVEIGPRPVRGYRVRMRFVLPASTDAPGAAATATERTVVTK